MCQLPANSPLGPLSHKSRCFPFFRFTARRQSRVPWTAISSSLRKQALETRLPTSLVSMMRSTPPDARSNRRQGVEIRTQIAADTWTNADFPFGEIPSGCGWDIPFL